MGLGTAIGNIIPTQAMASAVQQSQAQPAAPQPVGGKGNFRNIMAKTAIGAGNALGKTYGAQEPIFAQPAAPQPSQQGQLAQEPNTGGLPFDSTSMTTRADVMGGDRRPPGSQLSPFQTFQNFMGQMRGMSAEPGVLRPYQPSMPRFTEMRPDSNQPTSAGMIYQGPYVDNSFLRAQREARMAPLQNQAQQPLFDANTTQAEFDRARGITPSVQPTQPDQQQALQKQYAQAGEDYRNVTPDQIFARQQQQRAQDQMARQQMMQPQFMGGKGGGFGGGFSPYGGGFTPQGPIAGGYGGGYGYSPYYGPSYAPPGGGLGGLAALLQGGRGYMFNEGGEVK